jgi:hypothetical protein
MLKHLHNLTCNKQIEFAKNLDDYLDTKKPRKLPLNYKKFCTPLDFIYAIYDIFLVVAIFSFAYFLITIFATRRYQELSTPLYVKIFIIAVAGFYFIAVISQLIVAIRNMRKRRSILINGSLKEAKILNINEFKSYRSGKTLFKVELEIIDSQDYQNCFSLVRGEVVDHLQDIKNSSSNCVDIVYADIDEVILPLDVIRMERYI